MRSFFFLLCALVIGMSMTHSLPTQAQDTERVARVAIPDVSTIDPTTLSRFATHERDVVENLFAGLTRINATTGQIEGYLAESWSSNANGLLWTFELRDDVQWVRYQDNEVIALRPVHADDVVFAIQRACDPTRPSPQTSNILIIDGCREVQNLLDTWRITQSFLDNMIGVRAVDADTVEFRLAFPASYFLTISSLPEFRPLPRELVLGAASWPSVSTIATSGAWAVSDWTVSQMTLVSNPFWPAEREGNLESIELRFDIAAEDIPLRMSSGTLDVARLHSRAIETLQFAPDVTIQQTDGATQYLLGFSFEYPPFDNRLVRQALTLAVNRDALAQEMSRISEQDYSAIEHFTPQNVIATPSATGLSFNATTAQELLTAAGFPQCQGFPLGYQLVVHNDPLEIAIGQFIVNQWASNLGCSGVFTVGTASKQAIIDTAHGTVDLSEESETRRFALWLVSWTADYPDSDAWITSALHCTFGFFKPGRACDESDEFLDQAGILADVQGRSLAYTQAELNFFGETGSFPVIPLMQTQNYRGHQNWLQNINRYGAFQFDRWQLQLD